MTDYTPKQLQELNPAENLSLNDIIPIGQGDRDLRKATLTQLVQELNIGNNTAPKPIHINDADIFDDGVYSPVEEGEYTFLTPPLTYAKSEGITFFYKVNDSWLKNVTPVNFTPTGEVVADDPNAVSGGEVYLSLNKINSVNINSGKDYPLQGYLPNPELENNNSIIRDILLEAEIATWDNNYHYTIGAVFRNDVTFGYGIRLSRINKTTGAIGHTYITTLNSLSTATNESKLSLVKLSQAGVQRVLFETTVFGNFKAYLTFDFKAYGFSKLTLAENPNYDWKNFYFQQSVYNANSPQAQIDQISAYTKSVNSVNINQGREYPLKGYLTDEALAVNNQRIKDVLYNIEIITWDSNYNYTIGAVFKNDATFGYGIRLTRIHKETNVIGHVYITSTGDLSQATNASKDSLATLAIPGAKKVLVETASFNGFKAYVTFNLDLHTFTKITLAENPAYDWKNFYFEETAYFQEITSNNEPGTVVEYNTFKEALIARQLGMIKVGGMLAESSVSDIYYDAANFKPSMIYNQYRTFTSANVPSSVSSQLIKMTDEVGAVAYIKYIHGRYTYFGNSNYLYRTSDELAENVVTKDNVKYEKLKLPTVFPDEQIASTGKIESIIPLDNGEILIEVRNGIKENETDTDAQRRIQLYTTTGFKSLVPTTNAQGMTEYDLSTIISKVWEYYGGTNTNTKFGTTVCVKGNVLAISPYGAGRTGLMFISRDFGKTWKTIFNMNIPTWFTDSKGDFGAYPLPSQLNPVMPDNMWDAGGNTNYHVHGCAYDEYMNRFWVCTGDALTYYNGRTAIWYTDDDGINWTRMQVRGNNMLDSYYGLQAMAIYPMKNSVMFLSDSSTDGVYRWARADKDKVPVLEAAFWHLDQRMDVLKVIGSGFTQLNDSSFACVFHPNAEARHDKGFVVYSPDGLFFKVIYEDEISDGTSATPRLINWGTFLQKDRFGNLFVINRGADAIKLLM